MPMTWKWWTITGEAEAAGADSGPPRSVPPIHPGEILGEDFLQALGISAARLAAETGIPVAEVEAILNGQERITVETALRLGRYFSMSPQFWLNLQAHYDMETAWEDLADRITAEVRPLTRPTASEAA